MVELLAGILRQAEIAAPHPSPLPGGARGLTGVCLLIVIFPSPLISPLSLLGRGLG